MRPAATLIAADNLLWRVASWIASYTFVAVTGDLRRDLFRALEQRESLLGGRAIRREGSRRHLGGGLYVGTHARDAWLGFLTSAGFLRTALAGSSLTAKMPYAIRVVKAHEV
jgi:hypothetical protein